MKGEGGEEFGPQSQKPRAQSPVQILRFAQDDKFQRVGLAQVDEQPGLHVLHIAL